MTNNILLGFFDNSLSTNKKKRLDNFDLLIEKQKIGLVKIGISLIEFQIGLLKYDLFLAENIRGRKLSERLLQREKNDALKQKENWQGYFSDSLQNHPDIVRRMAEVTKELDNILVAYESVIKVSGSRDDKKAAPKKRLLTQEMRDDLTESITSLKEDIADTELSISEFENRTDPLIKEYIDFCKELIAKRRSRIEAKELFLGKGYFTTDDLDRSKTHTSTMKIK